MIFPWDELNDIRTKVERICYTDENGKRRCDREKLIDLVYEFLEYSWTMGVDNVNEGLSTSFVPQEPEMRREIYRKVAGEDFAERLSEYAETADLESIMRVVETDSHRLLNTAALTTAKKAGAKYKTWVTMMDDRVREEHQPLNTITVPINDYFVTWDGYRTDRPGNFGVPDLDIGCRCWLTFS